MHKIVGVFWVLRCSNSRWENISPKHPKVYTFQLCLLVLQSILVNQFPNLSPIKWSDFCINNLDSRDYVVWNGSSWFVNREQSRISSSLYKKTNILWFDASSERIHPHLFPCWQMKNTTWQMYATAETASHSINIGKWKVEGSVFKVYNRKRERNMFEM